MAKVNNVMIGSVLLVGVLLFLVLGVFEQQIVSGTAFEKAEYKIVSENSREVIIEMKATSESRIFDSGCNGRRGYALPSNFDSQGFQNVNPARNVNDLETGFYPITSVEVNNDVRTVFSDCGGDTKSLRPDLVLKGGECKVVMFQGGLAMDCRKINANLVPILEGQNVQATLKNLHAITLRVTIPKVQSIPEVIDPQLINTPLVAEPVEEEVVEEPLEDVIEGILDPEPIVIETTSATTDLDQDEMILLVTLGVVVILLLIISGIIIRRRS